MKNNDIIFFGTYEGVLDAKGRISIPANIRMLIQNESGLFVKPSPEGAIFAGRLSEIFNTHSNDNMQDIAPFVRPFPRIDSTGRISLPLQIRELAHLDVKTTVYVTGHNRYFAIRSQTNWHTEEARIRSRLTNNNEGGPG